MNIYGYIRVSTQEQSERFRRKHFYGQAVRQRFQPPALQAAGQKTKAGRPALYQEHRPAGAQL